MEEPFVIASLPKPLDSEEGRTFAAPVFGLSGSRKRKRHEVVVGIDGESVNIYNVRPSIDNQTYAHILTEFQVQTQNTIGSYAIPPQTYLTANPCSTFCKGPRSIKSQRQTVLTVSENSKRQASRLVSFTEESHRNTQKAQSFSAPVKKERVLKDGKVLGLDIIACRGDDEHSVSATATVVSYVNGTVGLYHTDSLEPIWDQAPNEQDDETLRVHHSTIVDVETASKGILRNREDVVENLRQETASTDNRRTYWLLVQVLTMQGSPWMRVSCIEARTHPSEKASYSAMRELFMCSLPSEASSDGRYELHAGSGLLYQLDRSLVTTYDVSSIAPRLTFSSDPKKTPNMHSFIRLTNSSTLLMSFRQATVYESKYGSIVSSSLISSWTPNDTKDDLKSRSGGRPKKAYVECISSLLDLGLVVLLVGNNLIGLQLGQAMRKTRRAKSEGPLLIDVMGRKRGAADGASAPAKNKRQKQLKQWEDEIDQLVEAKNAKGLEELIAKDLRFVTSDDDGGEKAQNGSLNGEPSPQDDVWRLDSKTFHDRPVDSIKAMYVLGKVFQQKAQDDQDASDEVQLRGTIKSRKVIEWLALSGLLTSSYIQLALSRSNNLSDRQPAIAPGSIMSALEQLEPDLSLVRDTLALPIYWDVSEVVQGVRSLMKTIYPHVEHSTALQNVVDGVSDGHDNHHGEQHGADMGQCEAASQDSQLRSRLAALKPLFVRLQAFPQETLTKTLRSMMNNEEIFFLIGILRLVLADAGWTSLYVDAAPSTSPDDLPIVNVVKVLSSAVDAIGAVGWIVGGSSTPEMTENLVACLRAEISAALESCYEATTLDTLLMELRRCEGSQFERTAREDQFEVKPEVMAGSTVLPLGSSIELPVVEDRSLWEGKMKQRPHAGTKNRFVGKYSFERIRF